jgi:hypothetical protein
MSILSFVRAIPVATFVILALSSRVAADTQCGQSPLTQDDLGAWAREVAASNRASHHRAIESSFAGAARVGGPLAARSIASLSGVGDLTSPENEHWSPEFGLPILDEYPSAAIEYRGDLVVAGMLRIAGGQPVNGIARWTSGGWQRLGNGVNPAYALAVYNDRLVAASWFGGLSSWNGEAWTSLPAPPITHVSALTVRDGLLYAGGHSPDGLGGEWGRVATYDGVRWTELGGIFDKPVLALGFFRGQLVAGGTFAKAGGNDCNYVARWDGASWLPLGAGIDPAASAGVRAIQEFGDRLIVGGWFDSCDGLATLGLASWDGREWAPLASAPAAYVEDMLVIDDRLYLAGRFAGVYSSVAYWDGTALNGTEEPLGDWVLALATLGGRLTAVGGFTSAGRCPSVKRMVGVAVEGPDGWQALERWESDMHGLASNVGVGEVRSVVVFRGEPVVGGMFQLGGDPPGWKSFPGIARWDGQSWQHLGEGPACSPWVLTVFGGDLISAGYYGTRRWDGERWHSMGQGMMGLVFALAEYRDRLYAGGEFRLNATGEQTTLAVWDGVEWRSVPGAPSAAEYNTPRVSALAVWDGMLYAGGNFLGAAAVSSSSVAAWDGRAWHAAGPGVRGEVRALQSFHGDLYAGGFMTHDAGYQGLMRWNGTAWNSMGLVNGGVQSLAAHGERLIVGGFQGVDRFVPGSIGLVAWDGERWSGFGSGVRGLPYSMCSYGDDLLLGGTFTLAGDRPSFGFARWNATPGIPEPPIQLDSPGGPPAATAPGLYVRSTLVTSLAQLSYSVPEAGRARLEVFDVRGVRVAALLDRVLPMGEGTMEWVPGAPPYPASGVYFVRLTQNGRAATAKVVFAR